MKKSNIISPMLNEIGTMPAIFLEDEFVIVVDYSGTPKETDTLEKLVKNPLAKRLISVNSNEVDNVRIMQLKQAVRMGDDNGSYLITPFGIQNVKEKKKVSVKGFTLGFFCDAAIERLGCANDHHDRSASAIGYSLNKN